MQKRKIQDDHSQSESESIHEANHLHASKHRKDSESKNRVTHVWYHHDGPMRTRCGQTFGQTSGQSDHTEYQISHIDREKNTQAYEIKCIDTEYVALTVTKWSLRDRYDVIAKEKAKMGQMIKMHEGHIKDLEHCFNIIADRSIQDSSLSESAKEQLDALSILIGKHKLEIRKIISGSRSHTIRYLKSNIQRGYSLPHGYECELVIESDKHEDMETGEHNIILSWFHEKSSEHMVGGNGKKKIYHSDIEIGDTIECVETINLFQ
jgi:hypothetical protein